MQSTLASWKSSALRISYAAAALFSLSACADEGMGPSTTMRLGAAAYAPQGYIKFCERRPDQCGLPSPMADDDRAKLEKTLNQQQWANVFNLRPTATASNASALAPAAIGNSVDAADLTLPSTDTDMGMAVEQPTENTLAEPLLPPPPYANDNPPKSLGSALVAATLTPSKTAIHLTPMVWAALNGVNQSINARIRPMSDEQAFGISDYWTLPLSEGPRAVGNCKHYALEKRKALVEAGFSPDALSLAIVKTGWGEVHAVLVVGTDQGDYVLDNLTPWVKGWQDVHYVWLERQTPGQPLRWAALATDSGIRYKVL